MDAASTLIVSNRSSGIVRGILIGLCVVPTVLVGWVSGFVALADYELVGAERVTVIVMLFGVVGVVMPLWLVRMRAELAVGPDEIRVRLVGLYGVRIDPTQVEGVVVDRVDPMTDYRGYGIKGSREDRLIGMSGTHGVRITHRHGDGYRTVTFLCDTADEASAAAGAIEAVATR